MTYTEKLQTAVTLSGTVLCVGLDPDPARLPRTLVNLQATIDQKILRFCEMVIQATCEHCAAYKLNLGFFEALGAPGFQVFEELLALIPPDKIIIADAKRGDIGNTATKYKEAFFDHWKVDAITLSPLMGFETLAPFLTSPNQGIYVLALTSNPGSADFFLKPFEEHPTLSAYIATRLADLNTRFSGSAGMVVGATHGAVLSQVLRCHPQAPLLIPGVGAQGGDVHDLYRVLESHPGIPLINVSRGILYCEDLIESELALGIEQRAQEFKASLAQISSLYTGGGTA